MSRERFYRADRAISRDHAGSGLGLAIAQGIIAEHQGRSSSRTCAGARKPLLHPFAPRASHTTGKLSISLSIRLHREQFGRRWFLLR